MTPTRRELHHCMKLAYAKGVVAGEARVLKGLSAIGHLNGAAPAVLKAGKWTPSDEAKHPRDHGKFSESPGATGTKDEPPKGRVKEEKEDEEKEDEEWDGTIDPDEVNSANTPIADQRGRWHDDDGKEHQIWLEDGKYTTPAGDDITVYRFVSFDHNDERDEEGEWVADRDDAKEQGEAYAEENNQEADPEDDDIPSDIDGQSWGDRDQIATYDKGGDTLSVRLDEAEFEFGGQTHTAYRWTTRRDDDGEWTLDKRQAIRDGKEYAEETNEEEEEDEQGDVDDRWAGFFGNDPDEWPTVQAVCGGGELSGASTTETVNGESVEAHLYHPKIETCDRTFGRDGHGRLFCHNDYFRVKEAYQGSGFGEQVFAAQVDACAAHGMAYIETHAAGHFGHESFNGYYTWPAFGYDQRLDHAASTGPKFDKARATFPNAESVLDIMATPVVELSEAEFADAKGKLEALDANLKKPRKERTSISGSEWWKLNGTALTHARFDLAPGSRSMAILAARRKSRVTKSWSAQKTSKSARTFGPTSRPTASRTSKTDRPLIDSRKFTPATRAAALLAWAAECEATGTDPTPGFDAILGDDAVVEKAWLPHLHPRSRDGRFIGRDRLQAAHANPGGKDAKQLRKDVKPEDRAKLEAVLSQGLDAVGRTQRGESKHRAQAKRAARALTKSAAMALVSKFADGSGTAEDVRALADHLKATWAEGGLSKDHLDLLQNVLGGGGRKRQEMVESLLAIARQATEPKAEPPTDADQDEAMDLARRQRQNAERQDREGIDPRPPLPTDDRDTERYDAARDKLSRMQGWAADKPHSLAAQEAVNRAAGRVEGTKQPTGVGTSAVSAGQPKEAEPTANPKESPVPRSAAQAAEESVLPPSTPPGLTPAEHRAQVKQVRTAARTAELTRRKDAGARREAERVAKRTPAEAPGLTTAKKELAAATPDSLAHRALDAAVDNITAMPADRYRDETPDRAALRHNRDVAGHLTSAWAAAHRLGAKPEELAPIERAMHAHGMEPVGTAGETVPHDAKYHDVGPAAGGSPPSGTPVTVGRPGWHLKEPGGDIYQTARANIVKSAGNPLTAGGIASAMHRDATAFTASAPLLPAPDLAKRREQLSAGIGRMNLPEPVKADLHARMAAATTSQQQAAIHTEALARLEGRWQKKARDAVGHEHRGKGPHGGEFTGTRGGGASGKLRRSRIRRRLDPGEPSVATNSPSDRANTSVEADPAVVATAEKWVAGSPGLPDHLKARYTGHLTAVLSRMPPAARTLAIEPVESTMGGAAVFHPDAASLSAAASKITGRRESGVIGFVHESSSRGAQLHLDGGTESDNPKVSQETYAHELWHCVDHGKVYSDRPKWQAAYKKDILKGRTLLSRYAMTNSAEGFAELGAAIHSKGAEYVKANFPTCWKFLEAEKLV